jgi:hypothetical protein
MAREDRCGSDHPISKCKPAWLSRNTFRQSATLKENPRLENIFFCQANDADIYTFQSLPNIHATSAALGYFSHREPRFEAGNNSWKPIAHRCCDMQASGSRPTDKRVVSGRFLVDFRHGFDCKRSEHPRWRVLRKRLVFRWMQKTGRASVCLCDYPNPRSVRQVICG